MFYSAIINTKSIEIDYSDEDGDFQEEMKRVIKHNAIEGKSFFVEHMGYTFSFLNDGKYTYACIANPDVGKNKYSSKIKEAF